VVDYGGLGMGKFDMVWTVEQIGTQEVGRDVGRLLISAQELL
jgi:hypothetical protein